MSSDNDFADMRGSPEMNGFGSLESPGAARHYRAEMGHAPDGSGVTATVHCDNCGLPNMVTVGWDELTAGANGALPPGWVYNQRHAAMQPNVGCRQCQKPLMALFTPDECVRHLKGGVASGKLSAEQLQAMSAQVQQRLGAMRR